MRTLMYMAPQVKEVSDWTISFQNVAYVAAALLFILALAGLSKQESARRGNWLGIAGMAFALV